jgi:hypothetical protein
MLPPHERLGIDATNAVVAADVPCWDGLYASEMAKQRRARVARRKGTKG